MQSSKNKVYGTDAWTPTRSNAQIETELNYDVLSRIRDNLENLLNKGFPAEWQQDAMNWINQWLYENQTSDSIDEMIPFMEAKIQTIVSSGDDQVKIYEGIRSADCPGVDRVVAIGEALDFSTVWDRKDLVELLSCTFLNEETNTKTE